MPDAVFDGADEVILVDLPADELLRRLREGKVYLPEQARHAVRNFFRKGNLIALRELALRRTADRVDDDVRATGARVDPVGVAHARGGAGLYRYRQRCRAGCQERAQAAGQLDCDCHVITVAAPRLAPVPEAERARLESAMRVAEELGARTETLAGSDMVHAVAGYVRRHNLTKVVLGRTPTRWRREDESLLMQGRSLLAWMLSPFLARAPGCSAARVLPMHCRPPVQRST